MDPVDTCGDDPPGVNKRTRDWHKWPRLRKTAARPPPSMQRADKHGPKRKKKPAAGGGEWEQSAAWPSLQKEARRGRHGADGGGAEEGGAAALRFACARCRDDSRYVAKDLVRHFEESHRGSAPVFACGACTFSTHEFSHLQLHLLSHKETFSSCAVCRDHVARTWPELSAHLAARHCHAGEYSCATCPKFSTGDVGVFLEHTYAHNVGDEGVEGLSAPAKGEGYGPKTSAQELRCQPCGFEASQKWLIAKHVKAVHVCQNGNQRKEEEEEEVGSLAVKPNDQIPKVKPRLTRSAVREMCWLTQDCLSLPGRDFLNKFCHLSDPRTTLEETQQFLMKSVTGDQKWTKALKTVLSNVPQDANANPKSDSVIAASLPDLTVLTVQNKITVAQNGAAYGKILKAATPSEKETPDGAPEDAPRVVVQNGGESNPSERAPPSECPRMQENGESREPMGDQEMEAGGKPPEGPTQPGGIGISGDRKLSNQSGEQTLAHKVTPKRKRRRRKRTARSKRSGGRSSGLKVVLKKSPVKEAQWLSPSSPSPPGSGPAGGDLPAPPCPQTAAAQDLQEEAQDLQEEAHQWTKATGAVLDDPSGAVASCPRRTPGEGLGSTPGPDGSVAPALRREAPGGAEELPERSVAEVAESRSPCPEDARRPASAPGTDRRESDDGMSSAADGAAPRSGSTESSPVSISFVTVQGAGDGDPPAGSCPDLLGNIRRSPSPPAARPWRPLPKHRARTLKLVAVRRSQPVKRPAGDQPVVVLNHPDACIPEVARIMEVIDRYRGEAQKVVLSRRTAAALAAAKASDPADSAACAVSAVQERFLLKLKLRRLSRKKYEVVDASSGGGGEEEEEEEEEEEAAAVFRCWFCGRLFACRETWTAHRRRHLTEWRKPNCENS
ncbi:zinc finger protein 518A-like isoform X2 [Pseudoliparis swirei]|uniref:zinc finger protein 518A-like isoform X2 n=1 Tax=Pseudoliparis swirei TaxID=2059687 RepID=UPI0024BDE475|nr:zinc finger protein 518A-like isoform X2 [Pseudoliparis swirei]